MSVFSFYYSAPKERSNNVDAVKQMRTTHVEAPVMLLSFFVVDPNRDIKQISKQC